MDLTWIVEAFATASIYTVTRRTANGFLRGVARPTTDQTFAIRGSVQPATGKDVLRLPELARTNETRVLFTATQLRTGDQGQSVEPDLVEVDGEQWEVAHVEDWAQSLPSSGGTYYRCIIVAPTPETTP